ncbi:inositol 2-dehydrogenase [Bacillus taeanensis]|uniref:Inositol 2-dehydrogenase n=1 Tax=Bacillus taeanensis TaxID=273032 RepID=A0A366XZC7_9BACI|nr:inositol 2-dehydrogenase [Bacillus taeanensis]RBW69281.1 inositol 2-dehydrogenase [Bacillus taeanensis]
MAEQIKCGVLGLGRLGYWHAENLASQVRGAKLVNVADPFGDAAEKTAQKLGVDNWTKNPAEILEDPNIDAVIIATPTSTHVEMIKKAAENGKQIFVEKPLTQYVHEADEVIEAIKKHNVTCQVGFMRRFDPAYSEAKRRILAGDIGKPIYFKAVSRDPGAPPAEFIKNSGGIFLDMSIHDYDVARFLIGEEVTSASAHGNILMNDFMEEFGDVDQALTYLTFESGAAADIEGSRNAAYGYDIRGEVIGTEGSIIIGSLKHHDVTVLTKQGSTHDIVPAFPERFKDAYTIEMQHFIDCLRLGEKPIVTEYDGKVALEIAAAATEAFKTGKRVKLKTAAVKA